MSFAEGLGMKETLQLLSLALGIQVGQTVSVL